jgi:hypothetical protein
MRLSDWLENGDKVCDAERVVAIQDVADDIGRTYRAAEDLPPRSASSHELRGENGINGLQRLQVWRAYAAFNVRVESSRPHV